MLSKIKFYKIIFIEAAYIISTKRGKVFTCPPQLEFTRGWKLPRLVRWVESSGGSIKPVVKKSP